jgi:FMN phosphatase YigB (HAD superfamily)
MRLSAPIRAVCFDWGGTLMSEVGPQDTSMANWPLVEVLPGVRDCLSALHGHYDLCVATNASISHRNDIQRALERGGLAHFFREIFCFMDLGYKKNQREFWQTVQSELGVSTREVAMVGDSLEYDAIAPRSFGVQSVWLNPGNSPCVTGQFPVVVQLQEFARLVLNAV